MPPFNPKTIQILDTHTGGEPTRIILGAPLPFEGRTLQEQRQEFRDRFDQIRRAAVCEPRGSDVMVGALLTPPETSESVAGVIFFNNVGYLGMCGHGTIGVAVALQHLGRIGTGPQRLDTPVGAVEFQLLDENRVQITNVPSFRYRRQVAVNLPTGQCIHGDIAWGGNWFFICHDHNQHIVPSEIEHLGQFTATIRKQLAAEGITGKGGEEIDHVELLGPATTEMADGKNYVMCPGAAYDRSPCGTGTSAKIACMAAEGDLAEGTTYRQESIIGSIFEASYQRIDATHILPTITGSAFVSGEGQLLLDPADPFCMGIEL